MLPDPTHVRRELLTHLATLLRLPATARIDYDQSLRRLGVLLVLLALTHPEALASLYAPPGQPGT